MDQQFAGKPISAPFAGGSDIEHMSETPNRRALHRRAQSETSFRFPDDLLLLDDVVADFNFSLLDAPMAVDSSKSESSNGGGDNSKPKAVDSVGHFRSLSVDADFFDGLGFGYGEGGIERMEEKPPPPPSEKRVFRHRHSNSMDGSATSSFEAESMLRTMDGAKKAIAPDRLAELSLIDPKRAKRILANRQSAARSKERKVRYTSELEKKVQTLQTEATNLSAQVTMLQRDTTELTTENKELKLRLQAMQEQAHLRDALNEALREEVQRLKIAAGQVQAGIENPYSRSLLPPFSSHPQSLHHFGNNQTHLPPQFDASQPPTDGQTPNGQPQLSFLGFNQRV